MNNKPELLSALTTEQPNKQAESMDTLSTLEIVALMNKQDADIIPAVHEALPAVALAIDSIVSRIKRGGRLFYVGAGTSGRLGVLDASECPPTFNVPDDLVVGIIAGGDSALRKSSEACEDSAEGGKDDLAAFHADSKDAVVAISASGRTPYCRGALQYAKQAGALTIALSCNRNAPFSDMADIAIEASTGPEVVSGSTRLKAGTATKMILNMLSTGVMIRLGKTYRNLMVDVRATNTKLRERALRLTMVAADVSRDQASEALRQSDGEVKVAIIMCLCNMSAGEARKALDSQEGFVRRVLEQRI